MTDADRFRRLFNDHHRPVLAFAVRRARTPEDGADIAAEAFAVAWRRLHTIQTGQERAWLFAVARKLLANHHRRVRRRLDLTTQLQEELREEARLLASPPGGGSLGQAVREAMLALTRQDRELLQLVAWDGLTPHEAATVLSITDEAARQRLRRARVRLQKILQERGVTATRVRDISGPDTATDTSPARQSAGGAR